MVVLTGFHCCFVPREHFFRAAKAFRVTWSKPNTSPKRDRVTSDFLSKLSTFVSVRRHQLYFTTRRGFSYPTMHCLSPREAFYKPIGHFWFSLGLCIKTRLSAQSLMWKWFFIHANNAHIHKTGWALDLILKVGVFGTRKWAISLFYFLLAY